MQNSSDNSSHERSTSRLHVLTVTPFYPNDRDEASGCFVAEPLVWLKERDIQNTVYAAQPVYRGSFSHGNAAVSARWIRYFSLPGGIGLPTAGVFLFARIVSAVRDLHKENPIRLIHAHGPLPCGHAAMLLSQELGIPYVVSVHGLDAFSTVQVTGRAGKWCRRIAQRVYGLSKRVICISERVREQVLEGMGGKARTSVVYNGVDPELFAPAKEESSECAPMVLSVGNLISIKGHEVLIRSFASLVGEYPGLTLEIIGDGPERGYLDSLAKELNVREGVRFLGRQSRQQVAEKMRRCTVFALPSSYEGLGCVYLEAMCAAKPVIGCRGQGIAEIIRQGSNGFLVGPGNEKELSLVLDMLLRDEQKRQNLGRAAHDTILAGFTLELQAERLARVYKESVA